ncbi:hypothetical protein COLO4_17513 [Corchorus olitorius]|uniref:SAP domain-containing protein n=1 Tax=Corchorus olitorius TaxID=93759 RepID=A0A1R3JCH7_9ROSI|nr:hypothetical protein COLO4_17513 [Corchorus olitorius]
MDLDPEDVFKDDEDDPDNESFQQSESSKEYVVYLVDASPKMFSTSCPGQDQEESHFRAAISCIAESLKTMIISRSYDEVAICFFNTKEKKNLQDLNGVFVFNVPEREHLDRPTARLIKEFDGIEESFMKEIGSQYGIVPGSRENSLYNALWAAQALLRKGSAKTADKRILLFTNEDDPFGSLHGAAKADMTRTTLQRAKDAQDLGISIELLPLSRPDEEFNVSAFYADLLGLDGEEVAQFMPSAGQKLEDMKDQLRKRAITWLDSVTNRPLKIERSLICEDTGALIEEPPKRFQSYRNLFYNFFLPDQTAPPRALFSDYVKFSVDEISEMKRISPGKLHLLGFKPLSCLKDYHNLRPSTFVYPSDQEVVGSTCIFIALHRSMLRHKRFAVAFHGSVSHPQLVALVAQDETTRPDGQIFPDTEDDAPEADEEQIQKAAALIKRIDVKDFSVCQFANPALQRHYAVLQALALEEDDIPETVDETLPDEEGLARPTVLKAIEAFKLSVYGEHYDEESDHLDKGDASRKRKAEDAAKLSANYDWGNLADNGQLKDLTVAALKTYLNAHNLPVTGKKEALISRILTHMGNKTFKCGNIQNVTFPFWGGDRAESCGHPELELTCQGGIPQISIMSVNYQVIEINIDIQAFTVARTDYLENLCPQKLANTTLDFTLLDYAWNLENVTLYYDCPRISNQSSGFPSQFNCSNNGSTGVLNYYMIASAFGNLSAESKGGLGNCRSNVIVPAFYTAAQTIVTNPTPDTVILPLRNGFGLKWNANIASKCQACDASGGRCGYNKTSSGFTCYCPDHTDSSTCNSPGTNGMSLKIKLIIGFGVAGAAILVVCLMVFTIRHKKQNIVLMNFQKGRKKNSERIEAFIMNKKFQCGNLQEVSFPFWGGDRPEECGYPELKLTCHGGVPQISLMSVSYQVIEINMDILAFTVARTDYLTNLCPQQLINTTFSFSLLWAWNLENVTLYYDCPRDINIVSQSSSGFPSQFNCSNRGTGLLLNYFVTDSAFQNLSAEVKGDLSTCQNNVVVPVFYTVAQSIEANPTLDDMIQPLRNGFGLKWNEKFYSKCQACNASGGVCGFDSIEFLCYCPNHTDSSNCLQSGLFTTMNTVF